MDHHSIEINKTNCVKYFEDRVHPTLSSSFPDLRISHHPGTHCARVYFGRKRKHASGIVYDGVSISVPTDRRGNRCQDKDVTCFTPKCIEGILLKNDGLRGMRVKMFSWTSPQEVVDSINNLNSE